MAFDHLVGTVGLHRVEVNIRPENAASRRVVEKLGFREEGLRPRYLHIDGDWRDHVVVRADGRGGPRRAAGPVARALISHGATRGRGAGPAAVRRIALRPVGAGVIYAVIIALWALVLVPMWVRRHDEASESRSVDRFHDAMRILSRRGTDMPDQRQVLQPRRQPVVDVVVTGGHRSSATRSRAEARASQAQRRRRTLAVLAGVLLVVAGPAPARRVCRCG